MLEGILFGDVRHTYSLEDKSRSGLFQQADRGTIHIKDIDEMSLGLQRLLLRVLTEGYVHPAGSRLDVKIDCRIIVTTKRDLEDMANEGLFLPELLAKLQSLTLEILRCVSAGRIF